MIRSVHVSNILDFIIDTHITNIYIMIRKNFSISQYTIYFKSKKINLIKIASITFIARIQ